MHNIDLQRRNQTHLRKYTQLPNTGGIKTPESCPLLFYNPNKPLNSILLQTSCSPPFFLPLAPPLSHKHTVEPVSFSVSLSPSLTVTEPRTKAFSLTG